MPIHYEIIGQITVKSDIESLRRKVSRKFTFGSYPSNVIHILYKTKNYISFLEKYCLQKQLTSDINANHIIGARTFVFSVFLYV